MDVASGSGASHKTAYYELADDELAAGSTLGGPLACATIKATGAVERFYSIEAGQEFFGSVLLHHWDGRTGVQLEPRTGSFIIHPEHQQHVFTLANDVAVHEDIFVLSGQPGDDGSVDPPALYYAVELRNDTQEPLTVSTFAFCQLRGDTAHDVLTTFSKRLNAFIAWNNSKKDYVRLFGCSVPVRSFETTSDHAKAVSEHCPQALSGKTDVAGGDPLAVLELSHDLKPGKAAKFTLLLSFSVRGKKDALRTYRSCPPADEALARTQEYYRDVLGRSIVVTPDPEVNRGVLWAKANMLRVQLKAPTGWAFTNDPGHSNNSVARDTAWFAYGADYLTPEFSRASLLAYVKRQEKSGEIIEYYDIRNGKAADYGLNINDNTPLLVLALWHHYNTTGDKDFLREVYPAAAKAARYILSQRNEQGLVWCTATGTSDFGIIGWRNVIQDYRLSGATTEVNSECYAALLTASQMARVLEKHEESAKFKQSAEQLRTDINTHLSNPSNGLYYLNITVEGVPRSDVTADLVFPVMFGVASSDKAALIIGRLSARDFWTEAGIRTVPRSAPYYSPGPKPAYGLLGGVWVAMSFWYAFAAAPFVPDFMAYALSVSFRHYSRDPKRNNTVPGQFSEWLHGETLVNEGMMLSPWFPPRYLWAAIEGAAGLDTSTGSLSVNPRLAPDWKWCAVQNLPYCGQRLTWFVARAPDMQMYANFHSPRESVPHEIFEQDISDKIHAGGEHIVFLGLRQDNHMIFFAGNTSDRTTSAALRVDAAFSGSYRVRVFDSLLGSWHDRGLLPGSAMEGGIAMRLERKGFWLVDLQQEL
ncbi:MAG: hypothetical protein GIX02_10830 [Candidatus Eremiobacteraeota bacterium]|nr:hypothetical protein [Candidatus Eremiobacteraeota bacterium]